MPNHCSNTTNITGPEQDLLSFIQQVTVQNEKGETITEIARQLIPMPDALANSDGVFATEEPHPNWAVMLADGKMSQEHYDKLVAHNAEAWKQQQANLEACGYTSWWTWTHDNWGTKWGDYDHWHEAQLEEAASGEILYKYITAWGPLDERFWAKVSEMFPTLTFTTAYSEPGMDFCGGISARNGVVASRYSDDLPEFVDDGSVDSWMNSIDEIADRLADESLEELNEMLSVS
jgi:hypothetical protein